MLIDPVPLDARSFELVYTRDPTRAAELVDGLPDGVLLQITTAVPLPAEWVRRTVPRASSARAVWIISQCDDRATLDALVASTTQPALRRALRQNPHCVLFDGTVPALTRSPVDAPLLPRDDEQLDEWLDLARGPDRIARALDVLRTSVTAPGVRGTLLTSLLRARHLPAAPRHPRHAVLDELTVSDREVLGWAVRSFGIVPAPGSIAERALLSLTEIIYEMDRAASLSQPVVPFDEDVIELLMGHPHHARAVYGTRAAAWATPAARRRLATDPRMWPVLTLREIGPGYASLPANLRIYLGYLLPADATESEARDWVDVVLAGRIAHPLGGLPSPDVLAPVVAALAPRRVVSLFSRMDPIYRVRMLCQPLVAARVISSKFPLPLFVGLVHRLGVDRRDTLNHLLEGSPTLTPTQPVVLLVRHVLRHVPGLAASMILNAPAPSPAHGVLYSVIEESPATPA